jgi:ArsR family transcriptional regulator
MLVSKLMDSECSVTEVERQLSIHQPTLSQQLTVLRNANIIEARRQSKNVFYRLSAGKPMQLIREIDRIFVLRVRAFE